MRLLRGGSGEPFAEHKYLWRDASFYVSQDMS
jgi:hypothetical protein